MALNLIIFVVGLAGLILFADMFVDGAVKLAQRFGLPKLIISLTLVALGTSAPEAVVSSVAALKGSDIALSNILGSNIANISIGLGLTAVFFPILMRVSTRIQTGIMIGVESILVLMLIIGNILGRIDGAILFILLIAYIWYTFRSEKKRQSNEEENLQSSSKVVQMLMKIIPIEGIVIATAVIIGLGGLIFSGNIVVDSAVVIARFFGMSEALIGATIVAVGTSLPEIITCLVAGFKKEYDIVLGNIIGSNILNILFILTLATLLKPMSFTQELWLQAVMMVVSAVVLFVLSFKKKLTRISGLLLLSIYIVFIVLS